MLWTFLRLRKSCKKASMNIYSDHNSDMFVTVKVQIAGQTDQAPRREGRQSSSQERGPGIRAPSSSAPSAPETPDTPSPVRWGRRRGPGALLRDERRRLARIEPDVLLLEEGEVEGEPSLPSDLASTPLDCRREDSQSSDVTHVVATPAPAGARACRRCGLSTKNHPGRCGLQHCTVPLPEGLRDTSDQEHSLALSPPAREGRMCDSEQLESSALDTSVVCEHYHGQEPCRLPSQPCWGCTGRVYYWCTHCKVLRGYQ